MAVAEVRTTVEAADIRRVTRQAIRAVILAAGTTNTKPSLPLMSHRIKPAPLGLMYTPR